MCAKIYLKRKLQVIYDSNKRRKYLHYFSTRQYFLLLRTPLQALTNRKQHCTKNYIFFFQMFFPVLSGKVIFLFPENVILFFRGKMKDDLSQKNTWKYDIFFNCSKKMVFPKKSHWHMIFLVSSGKIHFFFTKI